MNKIYIKFISKQAFFHWKLYNDTFYAVGPTNVVALVTNDSAIYYPVSYLLLKQQGYYSLILKDTAEAFNLSFVSICQNGLYKTFLDLFSGKNKNSNSWRIIE